MITRASIKEYDDLQRILIKGDDNIYLAPHPLLKPYISNYTITFPETACITDAYTVIPHGSATLVFGFDGCQIIGTLYGSATKAMKVGKQANAYRMLIIIEFQPWGLSEYVEIMQSDITDDIISLDNVNQKIHNQLVEVIAACENIKTLIIRMEHVLLNAMNAKINTCTSSAFHAATASIIHNTGMLTVKDITSSVFYSERQLNRMFQRYIGTNMKTFMRLVRINQAVKLLQVPHITIAETAQLLQYYDPSHFTRDFKLVCGITPILYKACMSDFYNEIAKF